jgi:outer membrane protein assembly factor BamB
VHALDRASGASIWKQDKLFLRRVSAPLAYGKMVAVADIQGVLHFLSRDDGSFVARMTTDGSPVVAPLQTLGGNVLVQTSKGSVYAIEAQ